MTREDVLKKIEAVATRLNDEFGVDELYLFGSVARGESGPDSDIDLLVAFRATPQLSEFLDLADFLEEVLQAKVDLVTMNGAKPKLLSRIEKEMLRAA